MGRVGGGRCDGPAGRGKVWRSQLSVTIWSPSPLSSGMGSPAGDTARILRPAAWSSIAWPSWRMPHSLVRIRSMTLPGWRRSTWSLFCVPRSGNSWRLTTSGNAARAASSSDAGPVPALRPISRSASATTDVGGPVGRLPWLGREDVGEAGLQRAIDVGDLLAFLRPAHGPQDQGGRNLELELVGDALLGRLSGDGNADRLVDRGVGVGKQAGRCGRRARPDRPRSPWPRPLRG